MTVTNPIEGVQDLFALSETDRTNRAPGSKLSEAQNNGAEGSEALETKFSRLLKGQFTENMVFTRIDQQLSLPQNMMTERAQAPVLDRRSDLPQRDDLDRLDASERPDDEIRDSIAAPAAVDQSYEMAPRIDVAVRNASRPQAEADSGRSAGTPLRGDGQQAAPGNTLNTGNNGTTGAAQMAANRATADAMTGEMALPELTVATQAVSKNGTGKLTVKVTLEQAQVASQPQSVLAAKSAIDATTDRGMSQAGTISGDGEGLLSDEDGLNTNSIFAPGKQRATAGAAQGANMANANNQAGPENTRANPPHLQANMVAQNAPHSIPTGAIGNATLSSLTGTMQSGMTTDASGGVATLSENNSVQHRSMPGPAHAASRTPSLPHQALADQLAVNIQKGVSSGLDKITVNLRPQELGRVEIKMELTHDGRLSAVVSAERPETLDMLRQDARSLIQSLADAGLQADPSSLSFNLQNQHADAGDAEGGATGNNPNAAGTADDKDPFETGFAFHETGGIGADGRLDVRI